MRWSTGCVPSRSGFFNLGSDASESCAIENLFQVSRSSYLRATVGWLYGFYGIGKV